MTTRDLAIDFLREEGYAPKIDDDGDVVFKAESRTFIYFNNENDQSFFQLAMPAIYDVTDDNRELVLEACNAVSREMKVAKACVINQQNSVWLFFENILDGTPVMADIMPRAIRTLMGSQRTFYEKVE